jgi:hypothetical protein
MKQFKSILLKNPIRSRGQFLGYAFKKTIDRQLTAMAQRLGMIGYA